MKNNVYKCPACGTLTEKDSEKDQHDVRCANCKDEAPLFVGSYFIGAIPSINK